MAFVGWLLVLLTGLLNRGFVKVFELASGDSGAVATTTNTALRAIGSFYGSFPLFVMAGIVIPIAEEAGFRGGKLDALRRHLPAKWANVMQASLFALLHLEWTSWPTLFVMGLVTGSLRSRTGGLAAGILLHAINNALAYLVHL